MPLRYVSLVSVIIPTYNHARFLDRALRSVISQTYPWFEIIVVDNHSTDHTDQVVANYSDSRIRYLKTKNQGVIAKSRNIGLEAAKGKWIAFLDSDDWWRHDKLEVCLRSVSGDVDLLHHDLEIVHTQEISWWKKWWSKRSRSSQLETPVLKSLLLGGNIISNSSVLVRRDLLHRVGGINDSKEMIAAEDYNTWLRVALVTDKFLYVRQTLGSYRVHSEAASRKNMSIPTRNAVEEFMDRLTSLERMRVEASFAYTAGRHHVYAGRFSEGKRDLTLAMMEGMPAVRIKSAMILVCFGIKRFFFADKDHLEAE